MKITLIGCGWLGLPLAIDLKNQGFNVHGSTTQPSKLEILQKNEIQSFLYDGDLQDKIPSSLLDSDWLIINFPPSKSRSYSEQIASLLDQFSKNTKIIFTSTTGIYLENEKEINENSPFNINHPVYLAEEEVRKSNRQNIILRLAGLIGEDRHPIKYLSGKIVKQGNTKVNLVHRNDVIRAILLILEKNYKGETFNICNPEHPAKKEYYSNAAIKMGYNMPIFETSLSPGKFINGNKISETLDFHYLSSI